MTGGEALFFAASAVSAVGQLQAGINAANAANFNAQANFNNAHAARLAAIEDAKRQKRIGVKRQGARRASPGGTDKLDLLEDNALEEELAVQSIIHAGEVQAVGFENNARLEIARGKTARSSSVFGAFTTVLMGAAPMIKGSFFSGGTTGAGAGAGAFGPSSTVFQPVTRFTNSGKQFFGPGSQLQLLT
jgi:hypothetical protein